MWHELDTQEHPPIVVEVRRKRTKGERASECLNTKASTRPPSPIDFIDWARPASLDDSRHYDDRTLGSLVNLMNIILVISSYV